MIVSTALENASDGKTVTVFGNDTDLIVMLLHHWNEDMENIVVRSEYTRNGVKWLKQLNIKEATSMLSTTVIDNLLFIRAFGGCDTTSAIHDKGKATILRLVPPYSKNPPTIALEHFCQFHHEIGKTLHQSPRKEVIILRIIIEFFFCELFE